MTTGSRRAWSLSAPKDCWNWLAVTRVEGMGKISNLAILSKAG
jgi:hypothetical protein